MNDFEWHLTTGSYTLMVYPVVYADISRGERSEHWTLRMSLVPQDSGREVNVHEHYKDLIEAMRAAEERIIRAKLEGKI
jgi:hypothetical protein